MTKLSLVVVIVVILGIGAGYLWMEQSVDYLDESTEIDSENEAFEIVTDDFEDDEDYVVDNGNGDSDSEIIAPELALAECLAEAGVVIYGSRTCPACARLVKEYGGYENMEPIYVECQDEPERCNREMLVNYVPAVQIKGEVFEGWASPAVLAEFVGCQI